jgi:hypothetical protein
VAPPFLASGEVAIGPILALYTYHVNNSFAIDKAKYLVSEEQVYSQLQNVIHRQHIDGAEDEHTQDFQIFFLSEASYPKISGVHHRHHS